MSYGYQCALTAGIPKAIVDRAVIVSKKLAENEPVERLETERTLSTLRLYEALVDEFKAFDVANGSVGMFLEKVRAAAL